MHQKFSSAVVRLRHLLLLLTLALTAIAGWQLQHLTIESDVIKYLPGDDPAVQLFDELGETFGGNHVAMVALEVDDVFTTESLTLVNDLTTSFAEQDGVLDVVSLTSILDFRETYGTVEVVKLVDPDAIPQTEEALEELRSYALSKSMYRSTVVSEDSRTTLIVCRLSEDANREALTKAIKKVAEERVGDTGELYYAGFPMLVSAMSDAVSQDITLLLPLILTTLLVVLYASLRSVRGVILPLGAVTVATIWAIGVMLYLEHPMTMITAAMPVVLLATGNAYGLHVVTRFDEYRAAGRSSEETTRLSLASVAAPVVVAGLTTFAGFSTLATSSLSITADFGIFTSLGVLFALGTAVLIVPSALSLLPTPPQSAAVDTRPRDLLTRPLHKAAELVTGHPTMIVLTAMALTVMAAFAIPGVRTEVDMISYFAKGSPPAQATNVLEERFGGSTPVYVDVRADLKHPGVLKHVRRLGRQMEAIPEIKQPQSVADLIVELDDVMVGRRGIPDTTPGIGNLWFFLDGQEIMAQLVNQDATRGLIQAKMGRIDTGATHVVSVRVQELIDAVPADIRTTPLADLQGEQRSEAVAARGRWIAEGVGLSVLKHTGVPLEEDAKTRVATLVTEQIQGVGKRPSPSTLAAIAAATRDYAGGSGVDIEFTPEGVELLASAMKEDASAEAVAAALQAAVAGTEAEEDGEGLEYAQESILQIVQDVTRSARVEALWTGVQPHLGLKGDTVDSALESDIRGDLWEVNNPDVYLDGEGAGVPIVLALGGVPLILNSMNTMLLDNQVQSMAMAIGLVLLIVTVQFRSLPIGLLSLTPIVVSVTTAFGLMALVGLPLDNATAMMASITIGVGIDFTIHFLTRLGREFEGTGDLEAALQRTIETTGRPILANTLTVALGFLVLSLSNVVPMRNAGLLLALNMATSAIGALTVMPAVILLVGARVFSKDHLSPHIQSEPQPARDAQ